MGQTSKAVSCAPNPGAPVTKRRLLLLANTSWYLWNFRLGLAEHLSQRGYEVIFAAAPDAYSARLAQSHDVVCFPLDRRGCNPVRELRTVWRVASLLKAIQPDVLLSWTPKANIYGALAARLVGVPAMPNVAGLGHAFTTAGPLAKMVGSLYRIALPACFLVFFQNTEDRRRFEDAGWVRRDAARLLPGSGVNLVHFSPRSRKRNLPFTFLFIGRLLRDKGLEELAAAARALNAAGMAHRIRVLGFIDSGNPTAVPEAQLDEWKRQGLIEVLGRSDDVRCALADADCVVLPSRYREGLPRVLLEAAACGRPVITTDAPGCRDAVDDGKTGFLCQPRDVPSLVDAMKRMMALSPEQREAMGRAGRAKMEREFSEEIVFEAYETALSEVLGAGSRAGSVPSGVE